MAADFESIKKKVANYYTGKIDRFGPSSQGVDWNSTESHELRFEQLLKVCDGDRGFSINDLGCGYGKMYEYMTSKGYEFQYFGYDLSPAMIEQAQRLHASENCRFFEGDQLREADYSVACGLFNVKLDVAAKDWQEYVLHGLDHLHRASRKGFAFNILTKYSDKEYMRDDLYYPDPAFYFDHCKTRYSRHIALLHDYPLYEFSIIVRKDN